MYVCVCMYVFDLRVNSPFNLAVLVMCMSVCAAIKRKEQSLYNLQTKCTNVPIRGDLHSSEASTEDMMFLKSTFAFIGSWLKKNKKNRFLPPCPPVDFFYFFLYNTWKPLSLSLRKSLVQFTVPSLNLDLKKDRINLTPSEFTRRENDITPRENQN